jgi:hypothetical protein
LEAIPPEDLLRALKLAETDACISVDLKRAEDISAELRFRHLVRNLYADELRLVPTTCEVQLKFSQQAPSPMRQSKEHGPWFQVHHANS